MHLFLLSDSFLSDSVDDASAHLCAPHKQTAGQAHRDGVVRGLVFFGLAAMLIALVAVSGLCQSAGADPIVASFSQSISALNGMNAATAKSAPVRRRTAGLSL